MVSSVVEIVTTELETRRLSFIQKPLIIGGRAMEFYGMRESGPDMDIVICDEDYQALAQEYPKKRKDIYGDLGVVLWPLEIWRSIALLDYTFLCDGATPFKAVSVISLERLMLLCVCALEHEKYRVDLELMTQYYYANFRNNFFLQEAEARISAYEKHNYVIYGGDYDD